MSGGDRLDQKKKPDQASSLRNMTSGKYENEQVHRPSRSVPRVISFTSGKGGVGKTNIVSNLAYILSEMGKSVFVLDADIGLANIDVLLGLTPEYNLQHVFAGQKNLSDIVVEGPGGIKILPASSGVQELSELTHDQKRFLLSEFGSITEDLDFFLIDTGAGISSNVMYFNMAAREKNVVVTPEPTSITDAYAIMKVMSQKHSVTNFNLIVNSTSGEREALALYENLSSVADKFLNISITFVGYILNDKRVPQAIRHQQPVSFLYPKADASMCFVQLAQNILNAAPPCSPEGTIGFFWNSIFEGTT
jgi:flagellar biosynthesis protein FlhG